MKLTLKLSNFLKLIKLISTKLVCLHNFNPLNLNASPKVHNCKYAHSHLQLPDFKGRFFQAGAFESEGSISISLSMTNGGFIDE